MALNDTEKQSVLFFLGYAGNTINSNSTSYNSGVASRLTNTQAPQETRVRACLAGLEKLDEKLAAASSRLAARKVDSIETNPEEIQQLKRERKRIAKEMATTLDLEYQGADGMISICI